MHHSNLELVPVWDPRANGPNRGYLVADPYPTRQAPKVAPSSALSEGRRLSAGLLDLIAECPGLTQLELRAFTAGQASRVNDALYQLEQRGLILVERHGQTRGRHAIPNTYYLAGSSCR